MSTTTREHVWTIDDVNALQGAGVLTERTQLMGGRLYDPMTPSPRHVTTVERIRRWLDHRLAPELTIRQEAPIRLDATSYPEPDLAIVSGSLDDFADVHPTPKEVLAVIEVSLTSLDADIAVKQPLYAAHGVRCIVVDVERQQFIEAGEALDRVTVAGLTIDVDELLTTS